MAFRGFVAVDVGALEAVVALRNDLRDLGADLKLVAPENVHLTMQFLGTVPEDRTQTIVDAMRHAAAGTPPFTAALRGVGTFPPKGAPRVIWIGVSEGADKLTNIAQRLRRALHDAEFELDRKPFRAHATIARTRTPRDSDRVRAFVNERRDHPLAEINVHELRLMRSELTPTGPQYALVQAVPLEA